MTTKVATNQMRKVMVGNKDYYVMFLHPYQVTDLRTNTNTGQWIDIQKAAMTGGQVSDNPIFTGALGIYNGVILFESVRMPTVVANVRRKEQEALSMSRELLSELRDFEREEMSA